MPDGLATKWEGRVWANPPYGKRGKDRIGPWLKKMAEHGQGVVLIFARTETEAWQDHVWPHADAMLFIAGRLTFLRPDGKPALDKHGKPAAAPAPSVLIAYGQKDATILRNSKLPGYFVDLRRGDGL